MTCKQCNEVETISHVLLYCPDIKLYWKKISDIIYMLFHIDIAVDERIILTGYDVSDEFDFTELNANFCSIHNLLPIYN